MSALRLATYISTEHCAAIMSEIWRALMRARTQKPVVASIGEIAASGGYSVGSAHRQVNEPSPSLDDLTSCSISSLVSGRHVSKRDRPIKSARARCAPATRDNRVVPAAVLPSARERANGPARFCPLGRGHFGAHATSLPPDRPWLQRSGNLFTVETEPAERFGAHTPLSKAQVQRLRVGYPGKIAVLHARRYGIVTETGTTPPGGTRTVRRMGAPLPNGRSSMRCRPDASGMRKGVRPTRFPRT